MEINALGRLKMLFQRPYISKPYGGACHGALDGGGGGGGGGFFWGAPPPPPNKSHLATALQLHEHVHVLIRCGN